MTPVADPIRDAPWPAVREARAHDPARRVPWTVGGVPAGSVARAHLGVLRRWPQWLRVVDDGRDGDHGDHVDLHAAPGLRDAALAAVNAALRDDGLVTGWRDETVEVPALAGAAAEVPLLPGAAVSPFAGTAVEARPLDEAGAEVPALAGDAALTRIERAAARFWGSRTRGAHASGVVAGTDGRPAALWVAQRSSRKVVDPGRWDNLVGGGVPAGESTWQALVREAGEEAGLADGDWLRAVPGRAVMVLRDGADGLQRERIDAWDLWLPPHWRPCNRDGEVQRFDCLPVADALALAAGGAMTVDAALVTLDFGLRHGLLAPPPGSQGLFGEVVAGAP